MVKKMRTVVIISLVIVIIASSATIIFSLFKMQHKDVNITPSETSQATSAYQYILKEYNGKLAVFSKDKSEPDVVFDVYISSLPDYDRANLIKGIGVDDYDELNRLIEDFTS